MNIEPIKSAETKKAPAPQTSIWPTDSEQWPEDKLQMYVCMMANRSGLLFHADSLGANKGVVGGNKMKLSGARAGWPDMVFLMPYGMAVWIELKTEAGVVSPAQKAVHEKMGMNGHLVRVVKARHGMDAWKQVRKLVGA